MSGGNLTWLQNDSESSIRSALRRAGTPFAELPFTFMRRPALDNPTFAQGSVTVGEDLFAKLAFSAETAGRIQHEADVLELLCDLGLPVPRLAHHSTDPAMLITERVAGEPLAYELVADSIPDRVDEIGAELASFLSRLHAPAILAAVTEQTGETPHNPDPGLQATTDELRGRFTAMVGPGQRPLVERWCDWTDAQLAQPGGAVLVHGDFHPYNQLWDAERLRLLAVMDFESSGTEAPEYDFRSLISFGPGVDLLLSTVDHYERLSGQRLDIARIMAVHVRTDLGDALWRTEAGYDLPGPGSTPSEYVEEIARRFELLGIAP